MLPTVALLLVLVFVGAAAQRIGGLGFGLLVSPFIVLLFGPYSGVLILNIAAIGSAGLILTQVHRDVDWKLFRRTILPTIAGIVGGSFVAHALSDAVLETAVGALLILGLTASLLVNRTQFVAHGPAWLVGSSFLAGAMNTTSGVGGPVMTVYAVLTRWSQKVFSATMQPYFMLTGLCSFLSKYLIDPGRFVSLPWYAWAGVFVVMIGGVFTGDRLAARIDGMAARRFVIAISYLGGVIALVHGLVLL